jgi:hypothetical protein
MRDMGAHKGARGNSASSCPSSFAVLAPFKGAPSKTRSFSRNALVMGSEARKKPLLSQ